MDDSSRDGAPKVERIDVPPEITMPAAMLSYACNLKGCCCQGWRIPFKPEDLARLAKHLPDDRHSEDLADGLIIVTEDDHRTIDHIRFEGVGDDDACRFLDPDGGCGVHREQGVDALPDLCVVFPAFTFVLGERFEAHHHGICPEVIEALARDPSPFATTTLPAPPDHLLERLRRGSSRLGRPLIYGHDLGEEEGWEAVHALRAAIARACADEGRPALETLAAICTGLDELKASADWRAFEPADAHDRVDPDRFLRYLVGAFGAFEPGMMATFFWKCRRFMLDHVFPDLPPETWEDLEGPLLDWGPAVAARIEPVEPALRGLLLRYMGHRYFEAPTTAWPDLRESFGVVPLIVAQALRVAAASAHCRGRTAELADLKVGLTTAEYTYRNCRYPASALPWF